MDVKAFTSKYDGISSHLLNCPTIKSTIDNEMFKIRALWDTGATCSCISEDLAKKMGLVATGMKTIKTPSGSSNQNTYCVDLYLPNFVAILALTVCDSKINNQGLDMIIGMDVITKGDFSISNYNQKTYFSFRVPSIKHADFVQEARLAKIIGKPHGKGR